MFTNFLNQVKENKGAAIGAGLGVIVASGLVFATWIGAFKKITIEEKEFKGGIFYYVDYKGHIRHIHKAY